MLAVIVFVFLAVGAPVARANTISIFVQQDAGALVMVASNNTGFISYTGAFGDFNFNSITATGSPILPEPALSSTSLDVQSSSGSHVLNIFITQFGITSPTGVNSFLSSFTSQTFSGAITSVLEQTFVDVGNGIGGTLLASSTFTGIGSYSSVNSTPSLSNPYSETVQYTITTHGSGRVNNTIDMDAFTDNFTTVPEPSSLLLSTLGLAGFLLAKRRLRTF